MRSSYIATFYVPGKRAPFERKFSTLTGALRFEARHMETGDHFVGEILDRRRVVIVPHDWLLDHWSDLVKTLNAGKPAYMSPSAAQFFDNDTGDPITFLD